MVRERKREKNKKQCGEKKGEPWRQKKEKGGIPLFYLLFSMPLLLICARTVAWCMKERGQGVYAKKKTSFVAHRAGLRHGAFACLREEEKKNRREKKEKKSVFHLFRCSTFSLALSDHRHRFLLVGFFSRLRLFLLPNRPRFPFTLSISIENEHLQVSKQ